jgi:hypothetical protein
MASFSRFRKIFEQIQVVRAPHRRLATFGESAISYLLVTDVPGLSDRSRLRSGQVRAERPALITSQKIKERFSGFGEESLDYVNWLTSRYGDALRGLEYNFKNETESTKLELLPPDALVHRLTNESDETGESRPAILRSSDHLWELSIMKLIVEETLSSFASNMQELTERGFFDQEPRTRGRREREIQTLFDRAKTDRSTVALLGRKLKEYDLFEKYQDAFFGLFQP